MNKWYENYMYSQTLAKKKFSNKHIQITCKGNILGFHGEDAGTIPDEIKSMNDLKSFLINNGYMINWKLFQLMLPITIIKWCGNES